MVFIWGCKFREFVLSLARIRYFAGTNFYHIENEIDDVDDRMTEAVAETAVSVRSNV